MQPQNPGPLPGGTQLPPAQAPLNQPPATPVNPNEIDLTKVRPAGSKPPIDPKQKLLMIIIGVGLALAIVFTIFGMVAGGDKGPDVRAVYISQLELAHLGEVGQKARNASAATHQLGASLKLLAISNSAQLSTLLLEQGVEGKDVAKTTPPNFAYDEKLKTAGLTNQFDAEFPKIVLTVLKEDNVELQALYSKTTDEKAKKLFKSMYDSNDQVIKSLTP